MEKEFPGDKQPPGDSFKWSSSQKRLPAEFLGCTGEALRVRTGSLREALRQEGAGFRSLREAMRREAGFRSLRKALRREGAGGFRSLREALRREGAGFRHSIGGVFQCGLPGCQEKKTKPEDKSFQSRGGERGTEQRGPGPRRKHGPQCKRGAGPRHRRRPCQRGAGPRHGRGPPCRREAGPEGEEEDWRSSSVSQTGKGL